MKFPDKIEKVLVFLESKAGLLLLASLILTFLLRFPSLTEPVWYGDEGITFTQAQTVRHGLSLYKDIFDNKPPLSYLLASLSFTLLGPSQWSARFVLLIWMLITQVIFFILVRRLFQQRVALISVFMLSLLLSTPYLEGNIYNGEILMILPTLLALHVALEKKYLTAGTLFAIAFLIKVPALFDFFGLLAFLWLQTKKMIDFNLIKTYLRLITGFLAVVLFVSMFFALNGTFNYYLDSAFLNNFAYTNSYNHLLIPNGLLILKALPVLGLLTIFKFHRKWNSQIEPNLQLVIVWSAFSLFGSLLSGRPYTHYLIQAAPPFIILISLLMDHFWKAWKEKNKQLKKVFLAEKWLIVYTLALILIVKFGFQGQSLGLDYYPNYLRFITGNMEVEDYQITFDKKVNRNYVLADYVREKTSPSDRILVLANEPQIYFMSERFPNDRYTTFYHLYLVKNGFAPVRETVNQAKPKVIIRETAEEFNDQAINQHLLENYTLTGTFEGAELYSRKDKP